VRETLRGKELAQTTTESFVEVAKLTSEIDAFIDAIAISSRDQASQIKKINDRASNLGQISSEYATAAEELASAMNHFHVARSSHTPWNRSAVRRQPDSYIRVKDSSLPRRAPRSGAA